MQVGLGLRIPWRTAGNVPAPRDVSNAMRAGGLDKPSGISTAVGVKREVPCWFLLNLLEFSCPRSNQNPSADAQLGSLLNVIFPVPRWRAYPRHLRNQVQVAA